MLALPATTWPPAGSACATTLQASIKAKASVWQRKLVAWAALAPELAETALPAADACSEVATQVPVA